MLESDVDNIPVDAGEDTKLSVSSATPVMVCEKEELINITAKFELV